MYRINKSTEMSEIKGTNLGFHCPVEPDEQLFCHRCRRQILDFTDKSAGDLEKAVRAANGPVCGKFRKSQLSDQFLKYAATAMIVTTMAVPVPGQQTRDRRHQTVCADTCATEEDVFLGTIVEFMAEPVGGNERFIAAIKAHVRYPKGLTGNGKVYVAFMIDTTGRLSDFCIVRGFHPLADQEALRVLSQLNYPFKPARRGGKPVAMRFVMPIEFKEPAGTH